METGLSPGLVHDSDYVLYGVGADHRIHLRQLIGYVRGIALSHAAGDDELLYEALLLELTGLQYDPYALLLGISYEAAGVYDDCVRLIHLGLIYIAL